MVRMKADGSQLPPGTGSPAPDRQGAPITWKEVDGPPRMPCCRLKPQRVLKVWFLHGQIGDGDCPCLEERF